MHKAPKSRFCDYVYNNTLILDSVVVLSVPWCMLLTQGFVLGWQWPAVARRDRPRSYISAAGAQRRRGKTRGGQA